MCFQTQFEPDKIFTVFGYKKDFDLNPITVESHEFLVCLCSSAMASGMAAEWKEF